MLKCPNCNHNLTPLTVNVSSYSRMDIDHCYYCGGFWFDHYEINRVPVKEILDYKNTVGGDELLNSGGSNKCPRDGAPLIELHSDSVPNDVIILQCPKCMGNFANKFALFRFKIAQKKKIDYFKAWKIPLPNLHSVLIPVFFLFLAGGTIMLVANNIRHDQNNRIKAAEIIKAPSVSISGQNTVLISFSTAIPVKSSIIYRAQTDKEPQTIPVSQTSGLSHFITLHNLTPNSDYFFKISIEDGGGNIITSPSYSFTTN